MSTHQKTITIEHPGAHQAPANALADAAREAEVPEGYSVRSFENVSGDRTKWVLVWEDAEPQADPAKSQR